MADVVPVYKSSRRLNIVLGVVILLIGVYLMRLGFSDIVLLKNSSEEKVTIGLFNTSVPIWVLLIRSVFTIGLGFVISGLGVMITITSLGCEKYTIDKKWSKFTVEQCSSEKLFM